MAQQAQFDLCGFARAEPIPKEALLDWLSEGFCADMDWMQARTAERLDIGRLLPGARTVMALACNYHWPSEAGTDSPIASYARGRDYHYTLRDRIRALRRTLKERHPEVKTFSSVDAAPVMEKVWAARAGLGYVGRNGLLITESFGSYVLLATLVLDVEVDRYAAGPALDRCGSCNLCVNACPTEAIAADAVVDARKCLSYQTIENQDVQLPQDIRRALSGMAFGCDICQDVCPLNSNPVQAGERFRPRAVANTTVRQLAAMTPEEYRTWVPGTPLARAQYDGLRRNAAYALGAARDVGARPILESLAVDESHCVREAAVWALGQLYS
jgi:epoxyqueuosine reductase